MHHSLVLRRSDVIAAERLSFRVRSDADLDPIAADFDRRGCTTRWVDGDHPGMGRALRVWDPFGFPLEFFHDIEQFETRLQRFDLHRGAPVMRLDHFNLHSPQVEETFAFWLELGFRCTEYISTDGDDERITGAWLTRKPTVHDVALTAGRGPRLHHLGFYVAEPSGVLRACDQLVGRRLRGVDRARAGAARRLQRVLRLPPRPGRAPDRALRVRLLHGRPRPGAAALVGVRRPLPFLLGRARARQLVRRVLARHRTGRTGGGDVGRERRRAHRTLRGDGVTTQGGHMTDAVTPQRARPPRVGFVGLGRMGWPMARNLAAAGHPLTVHDVDPGRLASFAAEHGCDAAAGPGAFAAAGIVVTMLPDDAAVRDAVLDRQGGIAPALAPGSVVVDMSSSSPMATRELGRRLAELGVGLVDSPVSGRCRARRGRHADADGRRGRRGRRGARPAGARGARRAAVPHRSGSARATP